MTERTLPAGLEAVVVAPERDLGSGFKVRRALPSRERQMVGPFIFVDQMGPVVFRSGQGLDVRPHPHIGLATVTYLFEGEILHRDTLGTVQPIQPGAVNWMTAGRGIAHSERTAPVIRAAGGTLFGMQVWLALPRRDEELPPSFVHHAAATLPAFEGDGVRLRVITGSFAGRTSPVATRSETLYLDVALDARARFALPASSLERAVYPVEGVVEVDGTSFSPGELLVFRRGADVVLSAPSRARLVVLGGEPADGPRHVYWNFVSSSKDRIEQAKADWRGDRFGRIPGDEVERIPLPDDPGPVRYP
jgi:redox-sensitive bicupin YhaK (pirin superfamily)